MAKYHGYEKEIYLSQFHQRIYLKFLFPDGTAVMELQLGRTGRCLCTDHLWPGQPSLAASVCCIIYSRVSHPDMPHLLG